MNCYFWETQLKLGLYSKISLCFMHLITKILIGVKNSCVYGFRPSLGKRCVPKIFLNYPKP
jgi:hypothetical protein